MKNTIVDLLDLFFYSSFIFICSNQFEKYNKQDIHTTVSRNDLGLCYYKL